MARQNKPVGGSVYMFAARKFVCQHCKGEFYNFNIKGRLPKYCSDRCKQAAYHMRKRGDKK